MIFFPHTASHIDNKFHFNEQQGKKPHNPIDWFVCLSFFLVVAVALPAPIKFLMLYRLGFGYIYYLSVNKQSCTLIDFIKPTKINYYSNVQIALTLIIPNTRSPLWVSFEIRWSNFEKENEKKTKIKMETKTSRSNVYILNHSPHYEIQCVKSTVVVSISQFLWL